MRPNLTDRTAAQIVAILHFELMVLQTELLGHGHIRPEHTHAPLTWGAS